jgi:hypothetical protein
MEVNVDYKIFDADSHYYGPDDCFTRHMEKAYADRAVMVDNPFDHPFLGSQAIGTRDQIIQRVENPQKPV